MAFEPFRFGVKLLQTVSTDNNYVVVTKLNSGKN